MTKKIFINAFVCDKSNKLKNVSIIVENGIIKEINNFSKDDQSTEKDIEIIDVQGLVLLPAGLDSHVHFNDPGFTNKETYSTGTMAAIRGGVTTVIDMPCTSLPPVVDLHGFERRIEALAHNIYANVGLRGGVSGNSFESGNVDRKMKELIGKGVFAFKVYLISGMDTFRSITSEQLKEVLKIAKSLNIVVDCHAEDPNIINKLTQKYKNDTDILAYAKSRPIEAEVKGIKTFLNALKKTKATGHIVHVASKEGADLIHKYKKEGIDVTFETCPHFLAFNQDDFYKLGSSLKTAPVVKFKEDSDALWEYLSDGIVDFVTTDHAPCPVAEKNTGSIWTDYGGIPGIETFMDYMYNEGVLKNRITIEKFIEITSLNASKRYRVKGVGKIEAGYYADFIMIDPNKERIVKGSEFFSKSKITPFENMKFKASIIKTFLQGEEVWSVDKGIIKPLRGTHIVKINY